MQDNDRMIFKILMLLGLGALLVVSAVLEGYTDHLHGYVIAFFAAALAACITTACVISIRRLLGLILFGFTIGFITQAIGVTSDMWCYKHTFIFAALSWSLAAVTMEGISKIIRFKVKGLTDKPVNVLIILLIFAVIPITLPIQDHWQYAMCRPIPDNREQIRENSKDQNTPVEQAKCFISREIPAEGCEDPESGFQPNVPFWVYYIVLLGFAIVLNYHTSLSELLSLILAALIMGGLSEWIGASAKLWSFRTATLPPLFLVLGCWPLEFLVIRGSAIRMEKEGGEEEEDCDREMLGQSS